MPFDLKNTNPAERFYYPDYATAMELPEAKREWVELRLCIGQALKEIEDKTKEKKVEHVQPKKKNGKINRRLPLQRIEYEGFIDGGEDLYHELTFGHIIHNWQIFDTDGKPIECTLENKMIMLNIQEFNVFVGEGMAAIADGDKLKKEDQEKNLLSSANGSQKSQAALNAEKPTKHMEKNRTAEAV